MSGRLTAGTIARALLDRRIVDGGRPFLVRAPMVGEALVLIATRRGFISGIEEDREAFLDVVRVWLMPSGLWGRIKALPAPILSAYVIAWAFDGLTDRSAREESGDAGDPAQAVKRVEDMMTQLESEDFGRMVADYAAAFRIDPFSVISSTPFPMLLTFRGEGVRVRYRDLYEGMIVSSLPGAEDGPDRRQAMDRLKRLAGIEDEVERFSTLSREEKDEMSRAAIATFEKLYGRRYGIS